MLDEHNPSREAQIAWAAGLFEGEGCINARLGRSGKVQMQARVGMTDRDVVERFAEVIGFGKIYVQDRSSRPNEKDVHTWVIYEAEKVREFAALMMPWMASRRRAQFEHALNEGQHIRPHNQKKTHCRKGHEFTPENTILENIPNRKTGVVYEARRCYICRREAERNRARRAKGITPDRYWKRYGHEGEVLGLTPANGGNGVSTGHLREGV